MQSYRPLLLAAAALFAAPAAATITIYSSPGEVNPDENVLFRDDQTGNPVYGYTNQSETEVTFLGTEELQTTASGQANLTSTDGGYDNITYYLSDSSLGFLETEFNVLVQSGDATSITVNFYDQFGNVFSDTFDLGNGQNFISARATDGQFITRVNWLTNGDVEDSRQYRVGGIAEIPGNGVIPEPAAWAMMIFGFGFVGHSLRRRQSPIAQKLN